MKKVGLWLLGIVAYAIFTLVMTPASWWLKLVKLPPNIELGPVTGTLWSGAAQGVSVKPLFIPSLRWQLDVGSLWRGQLGVRVEGGSLRDDKFPYFQLKAELTPSRVTVLPSNLRLPVAGILPNIQLPMPADASGSIVLSVTEYQLGQPYCSVLNGKASWQDARFKAPTGWIDLKAIHASLRCENGSIVLNTTPDNPLALQVQAEVQADSYKIAGTLKPDAAMPTEVHQAMQFVGPTDNEGRFILDLQGRIRTN
jgi:general secretion pathway protein N